MANRDISADRRLDADVAGRRCVETPTETERFSVRSRRFDTRLSATGRVIVRRLDAGSEVLNRACDEIVAKYRNIDLENYPIERFRREFSIADSRRVFEPGELRRFFALQTWDRMAHGRDPMSPHAAVQQVSSAKRASSAAATRPSGVDVPHAIKRPTSSRARANSQRILRRRQPSTPGRSWRRRRPTCRWRSA